MAPLRPCRRTPRALRAHGELHLRPQWSARIGTAASISVHPSHVSCPTGSSTYGPAGAFACAPPPISALSTLANDEWFQDELFTFVAIGLLCVLFV